MFAYARRAALAALCLAAHVVSLSDKDRAECLGKYRVHPNITHCVHVRTRVLCLTGDSCDIHTATGQAEVERYRRLCTGAGLADFENLCGSYKSQEPHAILAGVDATLVLEIALVIVLVAVVAGVCIVGLLEYEKKLTKARQTVPSWPAAHRLERWPPLRPSR